MGARRPIITLAEERFAAAMVRADISYRYEPRQFNMWADSHIKVRGFRPDFFLPEAGLYVEIGPKHHKRHKLAMMRRCFPNVRVVVIDNDLLVKRFRVGQEQRSRSVVERIRPETLMSWLWEMWTEQEYAVDKYEQERRVARDRAMAPRAPAVPSMRHQ